MSRDKGVLIFWIAYWVLFAIAVANEVAAYAGAPGIDWRWATADLLVWIAVGVWCLTDTR